MQKRQFHVIAAAALFLLAFVLSFSFRAYDDNRLFSWQWLFVHIDASLIYLLVVLSLAAAYFLAKVPVQEGREAAVLAAVTFIAVLPFWGEAEIIIDASRYFTQAKHLSQYGSGFFLKEWGRGIFAWTDLPLVPFCYGLLFKLFGESRMVIQLFTSLLFSLTTVLTYRIGRMLWDRETGMAAGLLLLGIPYLLTQVPLMLVDVPTMFLLMLSLAAFLEALVRGGTLRATGAVAAIVLFVFSKYTAWPMLSLHVVTWIVALFTRSTAGDRRFLRRGSIILVSAGFVAGMLLLLKYEVLSAQIHLLKEYQGPGLERWGEGHVSTFLFHVHPFITVSALVSVVIAFRQRDWSLLIAGWLLLLVLLFNIQRIRYILPVFPLLTLMAAYSLQSLKHDELQRFIVIGVVATSLSVAISAYLPFAKSMSAANLQHAGAFLDRLDAREIEVITVPPKDAVAGSLVSVALLDLYTAKRLKYAPLVPDPRLPKQGIAHSSLRFTWEFPVPAYYDGPAGQHGEVPVVVLMNREDKELPAPVALRLREHRRTASFHSGEGVFHYAPEAILYEPSGSDRRVHTYDASP